MKIDFKVDATEIEALVRQYPEVSLRVRESAVTEIMALLEREIKMETPFGAGPIHLRDTIFSEVRAQGQSVIGIVGTPLEHGVPVELGTKPHFPPIGPLTFWVEKKLGLAGEEAVSVAFAIAHTIAKRGTKGKKMFSNTLDDQRSRIDMIISQIPWEILRTAWGAT